MRTLPKRLFLFFSMYCLVTWTWVVPLTAEENWSRFRGPNGTGAGLSAKFESQFDKRDFNWTVDLPGIGHSSPVIWNDRIFVESADETTGKQYLLCIDAYEGKTTWQRDAEFSEYHIHELNSFASFTPAADKDRVYAIFGTPTELVLRAFDHDGKPVWRRSLGAYASQHGYGGSPILFEDLVIVTMLQEGDTDDVDRSFLVAFNCQTGERVWQIARGSNVASYSCPCIVEYDGQKQLICCSTADGMFSLDPRTGEENWHIKAFDKRTVSSPVTVAGLIFGSTGSGGGGNYVAAIRPNGSTPEEVYRVTTSAPYVPTPVAKDDLIFLWSDGGVVACLQADNGKVIWRKRVGEAAGAAFFASPICVGDRLLSVSADGDVFVLAASREFAELGRSALGSPSRTTPAVGHNRLYFRTYSQLISVGG